MTYQVSAIAANTDIPALVASFATTLGFTVTSVSATEKTIKHPTYTGAKIFTIRVNNTGSGATRRERIELALNVSGSIVAWAESPTLNPSQGNVATAVTTAQPTKLHLLGKMTGSSSDSGKSYIAGIIEYGFNLYRHFYLGYLEKTTAYNGGEVITGSCFQPVSRNGSTTSSFQLRYDSSQGGTGDNAYPFCAMTMAALTTTSNGGVYIDHVAKTTPWSSFYLGTSFASNNIDTAFSTLGDAVVIGGFKDSINSGYLAAGKSPYAGAQILTPINMYIGKRQSSQQYFQPIGRPPGVRLVHMEDLEPGSQISIGSSTWRVFPVFSKSASPFVTINVGIGSAWQFPPSNTSMFVGLAYEDVE